MSALAAFSCLIIKGANVPTLLKYKICFSYEETINDQKRLRTKVMKIDATNYDKAIEKVKLMWRPFGEIQINSWEIVKKEKL